MVLLDACARVARSAIVTVATFDHGTGVAATKAASLVERCAHERDLPCSIGRAASGLRGEAEWRAARWKFLRGVASGAFIATAHTRDDQIETVLMRELRGARARGLAGLAAPSSDVVRPFLRLARDDLAGYALRNGIEWVHDPSNDALRHLRNRVRHQILPPLLTAAPSLGDALVGLGERATALRVELDAFIDREIDCRLSGSTLVVDRDQLAGYDAEVLRLLWPALASRIGIALDRRGIERLCRFTLDGAVAGRIQLSGGFAAMLHRQSITIRVADRRETESEQPHDVPLGDGATIGMWRFLRVGDRSDEASRPWSAELAAGGTCTIRRWRPGDRMRVKEDQPPRRIKGLLRDAGVPAWDRAAWPVVLDDDEIVWVPGVRRGVAATDRSGRPLAWFRCERIDSA